MPAGVLPGFGVPVPIASMKLQMEPGFSQRTQKRHSILVGPSDKDHIGAVPIFLSSLGTQGMKLRVIRKGQKRDTFCATAPQILQIGTPRRKDHVIVRQRLQKPRCEVMGVPWVIS